LSALRREGRKESTGNPHKGAPGGPRAACEKPAVRVPLHG